LGQIHKNANAPHPISLLRTGSDRNCGRTAEQPDELAPSHCLPRGSGQGIHLDETSTSGAVVPDPRCPLWVKSGHVHCNRPCPLWAKSGLMHRSKHRLYSISSSASVSRFAGILRPSALAVAMLITRSTFVASSTGILAGVAPLRIRPA